MVQKQLCWGLLISLSILMCGGLTTAAIRGSCAEQTFKVGPNGKADWPHPIKVLKENAPLYTDVISSTPQGSLIFDTTLEVLDVKSNRVEVHKFGDNTSIGWMNRADLLCSISPLKGDSGLEQKLYIRTATKERDGEVSTIKAYRSPDLQECGGQGCKGLSRFAGYFIFAQSPTGYLLSGSYRLTETEPLVGWIARDDGFLWDTAYGLRPKEDLTFPTGSERAGQERTVCAYKELADARNDQNCQPLLGGPRWYLYEDRIPILGYVDRNGKTILNAGSRAYQPGEAFYRVVLPLAGIGANNAAGQTIDPSLFASSQEFTSLLNMKQVDIFFLIDGTASMQPYINAIRGTSSTDTSPSEGTRIYLPNVVQPTPEPGKINPIVLPAPGGTEVRNSTIAPGEGVVQHIVEGLRKDPQFKETRFRFGFRIYRDSYAGTQEIGEGMALPKSCQRSKQEEEDNLKEFYRKVAEVKSTEEIGDDYPENLFGGLLKATGDLAGCPDHTKLLFVIGDSGDKGPENMRSIVERLKGSDVNAVQNQSVGQDGKNTVIFFLQTTFQTEHVRNPEAYKASYDMFSNQAQEILRGVLAGTSQPNRIDQYLLRGLDDEQLPTKIVENVKNFSNSAVVNEIGLDLRGGEALVKIIEGLQQREEYRNLPGLFWDLIIQGSCDKLGPQCTDRIYDTILEGYLPVSEDIVEEVMLTSYNLSQWTNLLDMVASMSASSGAELRENFVRTLIDSLEKVIREPLYKDTGEKMEDYLKRKTGLPVRKHSPLFRHSIDELRDPNQVPNCELNLLSKWVYYVTQMLSIVKTGTSRPVYEVKAYDGSCPSGEDIPLINNDPRAEKLGDDTSMRYDHVFQNAQIYWVPGEFLP